MKRDARIGLAVVLVLGLMVTLLVGRAIYNSNADTAEMDGSLPALEGAAAHSDAVDSGGNVPAPAPAALQNESGLASNNFGPSSEALNRFVDDQSRSIGGGTVVNPAPVAPAGRAPVIEDNSVIVPLPPAPLGGDRTAAPAPRGNPPVVNNDDLDHESPHVGSTNAEAVPVDGWGYSVQAGDNIWKISSKVYGDGKFTQKIVDANKDVNVQKLKPGMVLKVPSLPNKTLLVKLPSYADAKAGRGAAPSVATHVSQPVAAARGVTAPPERTGGISTETALPGVEQKHVVQAGETLGNIANKYYGASGPKSVGRILAANKSVDPAKLKIGQELVIPAK